MLPSTAGATGAAAQKPAGLKIDFRLGAGLLDRPGRLGGITEQTNVTALRSDGDLRHPFVALSVPRDALVPGFVIFACQRPQAPGLFEKSER